MKGICFIEPLFHKVAKREKTQTRRIITPQPEYSERVGMIYKNICYGIGFCNPKDAYYNFARSSYASKYKVGEIVYLKEPYVVSKGGRVFRKYDKSDVSFLRYLGEDTEAKWVWKNKLFMPESAARYFIKITGVRAERLQDISEEDCLKEGIELYNNYDGTYGGHSAPASPREAYAALINSINGKGTWEKNPFVWVYDFELINK